MSGLSGVSAVQTQPFGGMGAFVFDEDLCVFTPLMDKRLSPGPFYTAPICQGHWDGTGTPDVVTFSSGALIGNLTQQQRVNFDSHQGSIVFWLTPEWDGDDGKAHYILDGGGTARFELRKSSTDDALRVWWGGQTLAIDVSTWTASTTYCVIIRVDTQNTVDGTNHACISVNNVHSYGMTNAPNVPSLLPTLYFGLTDSVAGSADAIIEGLTLYRRVLLDSNGYGVKDMNGNPLAAASDELTAIYAAGAGVDPTLVTGSEDVCACFPTDSTAEALVSGDGEAWSWPWDANLLDVWGAWDGGLPGTDYCVEFNGTSTAINCGSNAALDNLPAGGHFTAGVWVRIEASGTAWQTIASKGRWYITSEGWGLYFSGSTGGVYFRVVLADTVMNAFFIPSEDIRDGKWHYVAGYYNDTTKTGRVGADGQWGSANVGAGAYQADATYDLFVGAHQSGAQLGGGIAWWELWNNDHHGGAAGTDFIPPRASQTPPVVNLVETWWADEGTGVTVAARVTPGAPPGGCDGTIANGSWSSIWEQDGTPLIPYSLEFFTQNDGVDFGSGANIDNLPLADCTIEFWARLPPDVGTNTYILTKTNAVGGIGWWIRIAGSQIQTRFVHATPAETQNTIPLDNCWHHYAYDWDLGTLTLRSFRDGIFLSTSTAVGAYSADAAEDCLVNARGAIGQDDGKFAIGPIRLSNNRRYAAGNFVPPDRVNWVANDANAHLLCTMRDGAGATVTDTSGNGYNGTITFGADTKWHTTPDMEQDESGAGIYGPKGYNLGVDTAGEGMYIEQVVVAETDYVVFPVLSIGESGRARPQIRIYDVSNAANVVTFIGPMLYGTHAVGANSATLVPTTPRWIADALIGATVYNITDGSSATITDNSEGVVTGALAGGTENDWDVGDVFVIRFPHGYARWVWAESFCFQVPSQCTLLRVYIENVNAEGVIQVHQVQVVPNLILNGDMERGGGVPWVPTGWTDNLEAGDSQQGATVHSGVGSFQSLAMTPAGDTINYLPVGPAEGDFCAYGAWAYVTQGVAALGFWDHYDAQAVATDFRPAVGVNAQWETFVGAVRSDGAGPNGAWIDSAGPGNLLGFVDDVYLVALNPITLTVTPASFANSQETTGLRIDGRDDCQQPITNLTATRGEIRWNWTPRHNDADIADFGNATPYILWAAAPVANYIRLYWTAANNLRLEVNNGVITNADWATGGGAINAGVTYHMRIRYGVAGIRLLVDGVERINFLPVGGMDFGADVPTGMFWGAEPTPSLEGDATFAAYTVI